MRLTLRWRCGHLAILSAALLLNTGCAADGGHILPEGPRFASSQLSRPLVFDVGFNVGGDTHYYLRAGYRVVAIEANAGLISAALLKRPFSDAVASGQLLLLNAAVGKESGGNLTFWRHDGNFGETSSLDRKRCVQRRRKCLPHVVPVWSCADLMRAYGVPLYAKHVRWGSNRRAGLFCAERRLFETRGRTGSISRAPTPCASNPSRSTRGTTTPGRRT